MDTFKLNDQEIRSLEELRNNFDLPQVAAAFQDKTLEKWLLDCYYEQQAEQVRALGDAPSASAEEQLCQILGVDYMAAGGLTEEQRARCEKKRDMIRRYTDDPALLSHALDTATNQAELAELLHAGKKRVYLCGASFHVPIKESGVHYVGIGDPKMEAPFTEEQYRRAGITFENVHLPETVSEASIPMAKEAAAANGYDDFAEKHSRLATKLHFKLKTSQMDLPCRLDWDTSVASEFYKLKSSAETAARRVIDAAYEQANGYFTPGQRNCLAHALAEAYGAYIQKAGETVLDPLEKKPLQGISRIASLCQATKLVADATVRLQELFEEELRESADYYQMYKRSYFYEQLEIEKDDYNLDLFDSDLLNGLARFIHDESEYSPANLFETIGELENDVNSHAGTFFREAHRIYCEYCAEIEKFAEEIGDDLLGELGSQGFSPKVLA